MTSAQTLAAITLLIGTAIVAWLMLRKGGSTVDRESDMWSQSTLESDFGPDFGPARHAHGKPRAERPSHLSTRPGTIQ